MMQTDLKITNSEWEVMRTVWTKDKVTSREITDVLQRKKDWEPATVKTFLGRLVKKDMLTTEKEGKRFLYSANIPEHEFIRSTLDETFDNICDKDVGNTIVDLIEKSVLSVKDIENLENIIAMKKKDAVDEVPCNCTPGQCKCNMQHNG